ncbi:MAG: winged helix-turn-helix transcriptional regulator [Candidatus Thermoplasmatota archaeon]
MNTRGRVQTIIFVLYFLLAVSICSLNILVFASDYSSSETSPANTSSAQKHHEIDTTGEKSNVPYTSLITKTSLKKYPQIINGTKTTVIELPENSTVIQLPNNRIGVDYADVEKTVFPEGTRLTSHEKDILISIPEQPDTIKASNVLILPVEKITSSALIVQKIPKLDHYQVTITLPSFSSPVFHENINHYTIDWGDETIETYTKDDQVITHTYTNSGQYTIVFAITDSFGFTYELNKNCTVEYEGDLLRSYYVLEANKEPVAVTTSTSLGLLALGFIALTETGKYKFLALLIVFIPLYTRIQKEDVLDQFVRGQIYGFIKTNPGVHYNQIRRKIDVKNGTLSYHLWVLEKTELIKSRREGLRYRAFYPTAMKFPKEERFRLTELQIQIVNLIQQNPGIHQKEIARVLHQKPQTINYNIKILAQADIIQVSKKGRKTRCYTKTRKQDETTTTT